MHDSRAAAQFRRVSNIEPVRWTTVHSRNYVERNSTMNLSGRVELPHIILIVVLGISFVNKLNLFFPSTQQ